MKQHQRTGFTIVELLIVIVVIAIIAAVSIVTYTGVQARANHVSIVNTVAQWKKLIELYGQSGEVQSLDISALSGASAYSRMCLGSSANFPATSNYANGECSTAFNARVYESFFSQLKQYGSLSGSLPETYSGVRGLIFKSNTRSSVGNNPVDPNAQPTLEYFLQSKGNGPYTNADCGIEGSIATNWGPQTHCEVPVNIKIPMYGGNISYGYF